MTAADTARRLIQSQARALDTLAVALNWPRFDEAVDLLAGASGRVVLTGMGKSGLIGRKIAATLASLGTPALFVHPAEAAHGDLGMIAAGDAVLALSKSGRSEELAVVIDHCHRLAVPVVGVTGSAVAPLAKASALTLLLPGVDEACSTIPAPTTSTTMMLALGDALAVALAEKRGFDRRAFGALHPGGALGKKVRA